MKKYLSILISTFAVIYLLGAFYEVSFDISSWTEDSRKYVVILSGLAFGIITIFTYIDIKSEE